jgi:hypothetical protein
MTPQDFEIGQRVRVEKDTNGWTPGDVGIVTSLPGQDLTRDNEIGVRPESGKGVEMYVVPARGEVYPVSDKYEAPNRYVTIATVGAFMVSDRKEYDKYISDLRDEGLSFFVIESSTFKAAAIIANQIQDELHYVYKDKRDELTDSL